MQVRFSILMPVYNREKYVRQAVDSVLSQSFTDYEFFAIDDGSTDHSAEILKSYGPRIKFLQQPNQGPEIARNKAAAFAQGEYLVFLDSDDFFFPFALETFDRVLRTFDSPPLILGAMLFLKDGEAIPSQVFAPGPLKMFKYRDYLSKTRELGTNCIVVRKSAFDEVGGMRDSTPQDFHGDDTHLLLKLGTHSPCIVIDKPYTSVYRLHRKNSCKDLEAISDALIRLADSERQGDYLGGAKRRFARYACIGGRAGGWAFNYCWRSGERRLALKVLRRTAPMVLAAIWKRSLRFFRKPTAPIIFPTADFVPAKDQPAAARSIQRAQSR